MSQESTLEVQVLKSPMKGKRVSVNSPVWKGMGVVREVLWYPPGSVSRHEQTHYYVKMDKRWDNCTSRSFTPEEVDVP